MTFKDRETLRRLAGETAEIAALPVHARTAAEWTRLNKLQPGRPLVWINEIPWWQMDVDGELALHCEDEFCREVESAMRKTLYQWRHLPADMVVEDVFHLAPVLHDTGFGIRPVTDRVTADTLPSKHFQPQIHEMSDVDKIAFPEVTLDRAETDRRFELLDDAFRGLLRVHRRGVAHQWFAPWDALIQWYGVQEAMLDLALRPELVHAAMQRLVDAFLHRLRQYEALNLLDFTHGNLRIGSGGLGYTDELPQPDCDPGRVRTVDQWGCATAQIFSEVSPEMHEEFALRYERRWLERFGLVYYGCCEPLHRKMQVLNSIGNLRKVSMNYRIDAGMAAESVGNRYVFSYKPNPAFLAREHWDVEAVKRDLRGVLQQTRGCVVEIILKDISTVAHQPRRLWEWEQAAMSVALE